MTCFVDVSGARRTSWQRSLSCGFMTGVYVSHIAPRHPRHQHLQRRKMYICDLKFLYLISAAAQRICCFWEDQETHQNHKYDMFFLLYTLPETNSSHLKIGYPKRNSIFQPSIFRCKRFRECNMTKIPSWERTSRCLSLVAWNVSLKGGGKPFLWKMWWCLILPRHMLFPGSPRPNKEWSLGWSR